MIAFWTRSDGGSGFSFDASLIGLWIMSSRSSSSIGLPGSYGAMPRMCSFASDSHCIGMLSPLEGRVGPEDHQEHGPLPDLAQDGRAGGGGPVAFELRQPTTPPRRAAGRAASALRAGEPS